MKFTPRTTNMGFTFPWRSFELRVAQRYTSAFLDAYAVAPQARARYRAITNVDISLKYQFSKGLTVYLDALNVGNKSPEQYTSNDEGRILFSDVFGTRLNMGITGRF